MIRFSIVALCLVLVTVPAAANPIAAAPTPTVVVLLASDQPAYRLGTTATFTVAVDNPGTTAAMISFGSAQQYDIAVLAGETEVWRWSADRAFAAVMSDQSFRPGLTLLGRESWDWRDSAGAPLPPGTYRVVGSLATIPPQDGNVLEISLSAP